MVVEAMIAIFAPLVTDLNRSVFVVLIRAHLICENEMVEAINQNQSEADSWLGSISTALCDTEQRAGDVRKIQAETSRHLKMPIRK